MKKLSYILAGFSLLLSASCVRDDDASSFGNDKLKVEFEVSGFTAHGATRASIPAEEGETGVSSLYLLFFASGDNGTFIDYVKVDEATSMSADIDLTQHPSITAADPYEILAIANIADEVYISDNNHTLSVENWMQQWAGMGRRQVMQEALAMVSGGSNDINTIAPDRLLMSASFSKPAGDSKISLLLTRAVARYDIYNTPNESYDLVTASIWNAYPEVSVWGGVSMDYSAGTPRIQRFYGLDNSSNTTGQAGADGKGELLDNIVGGLYSFENQVMAPMQVDKLTTCLIVGLRNRADGTTSYYRANVNPDGSPQIISRNNVYRLTITDVTGPGYDTEEIAYNGRGNSLIYNVNVWNMDDNGLIIQDANSILSLPTKTINIGRDGGDFDYSVFISSKLADPGPLTIFSQMYDPSDGGIVTTINGNIIHVEATPLALSQNERRGIVILTYAGLQGAINIVQSGDAETFLRVTLPEGGIPAFQPYANLYSGLVTVEASGPWSAKIYMDGFSFIDGNSVTEIKSTDVAYVTDDKFRIYTNSENPEPELRQAFIVVSLDSDPENYSSVIRVSQRPTGEIKIEPEQEQVTFTGTGALSVASPSQSNTNTFIVKPNQTKPDSSQFVPSWEAELVPAGSFDDTSLFTITTANWDTNVVDNNILTVETAGPNTTGRILLATLRVYLSDDHDTYTDIALRQNVIEWDIPANPKDIPVTGGTTGELTITVPAELSDLHYTVEVQSIRPAGLVDHFAYVVDTGDGDPAPYSSLQPNEVAKSFRVGFPKLIWPNIDMEPMATIAVTLVETGETKTFTVTQEAIPQRAVKALDAGSYSWGNISSTAQNSTWTADWYGTYQTIFVNNLDPGNSDGAANFGPSGTVKTISDLSLSSAHTAAAWNSVWPVVKNDVTFINYTRPSAMAQPNSDIWNWMNSTAEGVVLINTEGAAAEATADFTSYIPGQLGLTGGDAPALSCGINPVAGNKVIDYLLDGPFGTVTNTGITFANSGVRSYIDASSIEALGNDAVSVLQAQSGGVMMSILMIYPSRNVIVKCDSEMFGASVTSTDKVIFMRNLLGYIVNNAQYGNYFSDYFWNSPRVLMTAPQAQ